MLITPTKPSPKYEKCKECIWDIDAISEYIELKIKVSKLEREILRLRAIVGEIKAKSEQALEMNDGHNKQD